MRTAGTVRPCARASPATEFPAAASLTQGVDLQRLIQPQAPAGDIPQRIAHQTGGVVDVGQHLITIDFAVGGEGADDREQTLARHAAHRRKLTRGRNHHANFIAAINPSWPASCSPRITLYLPACRSLCLTFTVWSQRIVLRRINAQHNPDRHAARALQHHVAGGDRRYAGYPSFASRSGSC